MRYATRAAHPQQQNSARRNTTVRNACFVVVIALLLVGVYLATPKVESKAESKIATQSVPLAPSSRAVRAPRVLSSEMEYRGDAKFVDKLQSGVARPVSLATQDFNLDGAPDLVTGYSSTENFITIEFGNIDAFVPSSPAVYAAIQRGEMPSSFAGPVQTIAVPTQADLISAGDFNMDGLPDILAATRGGGLYLLAGRGVKDFDAPVQISLGGGVTAIGKGKFNLGGSVEDVAVAINGPEGPAVAVFDDQAGGILSAPAVYRIPAEATSVTLESFDEDVFYDVAAVTDSQLQIIHGSGRNKIRSLDSRVESIPLGFTARSLVAGNFVWDREDHKELAVVASDGSVNVLKQEALDTRPYTEAELAQGKWERENKQARSEDSDHLQFERGWTPGQAEWISTGRVSGLQANAGLLLATNVSSKVTNDLIVPDASSQRLNVVFGAGERLTTTNDDKSTPTNAEMSVEVTGEPTAVLEMPRKVNGSRDVIVVTATASSKDVITINVATNITVDTNADNPGLSACTGAAGDCSLRGAIQGFAVIAANQPATINVPANTYLLSHANGDIAVDGDGTTLVGAGAATTIIDQTIAGQRIFFVDVTLPIADFDFAISGLTLQDGTRTSNSGAAILAGGNNSTTNITNCTFQNNTIDIPPAALFGNGGAIVHTLGGVAGTDTGDLTIIASRFLNNIAENVGGGLAFDGGTGTPTATIRNCVFNNNQSRINDGGGMNLTAAGGSGSYTLTQNTFIENDILDGVADHDGGAVNKGNGVLSASFNRFFHNSVNSGGIGDSAFRAAGEGNVNVSNNWWGCNGDPSTPAAGCDKVESAPAPGSTFTLNPRLQLTMTATPPEICINTSTTLTASMLINTASANVGVTNLYVFTGVPPASPAGVPAATPLGILFDNPILGTLSSPQTQIQSTGTATATFNAGATGGNGSARVTVDNAQVTTTIPIAQPIINAAAGVTRQQGSPVSNSQIATATDTISAPALVVTVNGGASATVNGVTVSNIVWNSGTNAVTADVIASCIATNASFTLVVTDRLNCVSSSSTLNVAVTANTPPSLGTYSDPGLKAQGSNFTVTPSAAPTDNGTVVSLTASAPGFTGTFSGNTTTGVISVTNANPSGTYTVTVVATDNCGATTTRTFSLTINTPPDIVAAGALTRQQGSPSSNSQIATVSDVNQAANTLAVTVNGGASATVNGVTVSNIAISVGGNVTADVVASCVATNATFTLTATDNLSATDTDTLTVNVTPNTPPTLGNYPNTGPVLLGSNFTVTPDAAPTDNGSISTLTAAAPGFAGTFSGNTTTGVISVTNASPSGTYTVTVTATDNCGATSTKTFELIVNTAPVITGVAPLARQQGSPSANSQIATVSDTNQAANTLVVTVNGGSSATVNGVTVSNIVVDVSGNVTADIVASCAATNATFTLTVTDTLGATDTDPLTVNVSANTPPTLGNYPNTNVNVGAGTTVTPDAAPTDNGSISTLTAAAPGFAGTFSGNTTTGVITVSNAAPAGSYTVTVTATDNCGATSTKTFTLDVQAAQPEIVIHDAQVAEPGSGSTNMLFTVSLSAPAPGTVTVNFTTNTGGSNPATAGSDYTTTSGTVTFMTGQQVQSIPVPVLNDVDNAETDETFLVDLSTPSGATISDGQAVGTITVASPAGTFVISELRTNGPGGLGDDFVEFYNNTNSPIVVAASDASAGYGVFKMGATCGDTPILIGVIPNTTTIPARGHYLMVGSAYSLANYGGTGAAAGNLTFSSDIETDANVAIFSTSNVANISSTNRLDAVGFGTNTAGNCDLLREGSTLPSTGVPNLEGSYQRDQCGKLASPTIFGACPSGFLPKDSNNNVGDFFWADTAATATPAGQHLGAPGPENIASPIVRNSVVGLMLDATKAASAEPNRGRNLTPVTNGANGTLTIRRRFRNDTGAPVTRLRFRVVDISTAFTPAGIADMRALSSGDISISGIMDSQTCFASTGSASTPCTIDVKGTTLEQPPNQINGGGNNSTLTVTLGTPLPNGASLNIQVVLGVQTTGSFKFFFNVEALP